MIDKQDAAFHNQHLGPNYREDVKVMTQLDTIIGNQLKADKNQLATIIKAGLAITDPPTPVPRLGLLVANVYATMHSIFRDVSLDSISQDARITNAAKARLAYIRLMITRNQLERAKNAGANTPTFWNQIDDDLQVRMRHPPTYHFAFSKLILQKDQALWDGTRSYGDITMDDVSLPTEAEIQARG